MTGSSFLKGIVDNLAGRQGSANRSAIDALLWVPGGQSSNASVVIQIMTRLQAADRPRVRLIDRLQDKVSLEDVAEAALAVVYFDNAGHVPEAFVLGLRRGDLRKKTLFIAPKLAQPAHLFLAGLGVNVQSQLPTVDEIRSLVTSRS